jgi:hypothetical protein
LAIVAQHHVLGISALSLDPGHLPRKPIIFHLVLGHFTRSLSHHRKLSPVHSGKENADVCWCNRQTTRAHLQRKTNQILLPGGPSRQGHSLELLFVQFDVYPLQQAPRTIKW